MLDGSRIEVSSRELAQSCRENSLSATERGRYVRRRVTVQLYLDDPYIVAVLGPEGQFIAAFNRRRLSINRRDPSNFDLLGCSNHFL